MLGFPAGTGGKEPTCQCRRHKRCGFDPRVRKIPWNRKWQPTPVFLPGKFPGQRSLAGYVGSQRVGLWLSTHTQKSIDNSSMLTALKLGKERECQERADMKSGHCTGLYENSCLTCWWTCSCTCGWSWKFFAYSVVAGSLGPQVANLSVSLPTAVINTVCLPVASQ